MSRMNYRNWKRALLIACASFWSASAAAVPTEIAYVGELRYDSGTPFQGVASVTAALYASSTGGAPVWGPHTWPTLEIDGGVISFLFGGSQSPPIGASALNQPALWLQLVVNGAVLEPRQRMVSVPYARLAADSASLGGQPATSYATAAAVQNLLANYATLEVLTDLFVGDFALADQLCPAGSVAVGVNDAGGLVCEPGPFSAASCSACLEPVLQGQQAIAANLNTLQGTVFTVNTAVSQVNAAVQGVASTANSTLSVVQQVRGQTAAYSLTCDDWSARGWATRNDCLQDGRWHRVLRIQGPFTVPNIIDGATQAFCNNTPPIATEYLISFDDNVNPWLRCHSSWECGDTWCYDGAGTLRLRIQNGVGDNVNLSASSSTNNNVTYLVRY